MVVTCKIKVFDRPYRNVLATGSQHRLNIFATFFFILRVIVSLALYCSVDFEFCGQETVKFT